MNRDALSLNKMGVSTECERVQTEPNPNTIITLQQGEEAIFAVLSECAILDRSQGQKQTFSF